MQKFSNGTTYDVWFTSGAVVLDDHSGTIVIHTTTGNFRVTDPLATVTAFFDTQADTRDQTVTPVTTV